ncbi:unnamed protein product [Clonostachys rosea]|uniref:BZIP domain-containing protein n=1 Tax=Bionectria ochroleuca TaxID=29856 RepID=A0ABY6U2L4_BIOOC|nr:unnamed protein product [Clonostachys rosea]
MTTTPDTRRSRPTSAPSNDSPSPTMVRSSSADQAKVSKRKGTRSVSTLTPAQLARKRANDREAQRAIRARTKEHIERLESELEELRSQQSRDKTLQELLRRNKALEEELRRLRETMGVSLTSSPYSTPVYDDNLSTASGPITSPRTSPFPTSDFGSSGQLPEYAPGYVPFPNNTESWASGVTNSVPSTVSSPASSATPDEYVTPYLPTSAPAGLISPNGNGHRGGQEIKMEYEDGNDHGFHLGSRSATGTPPMPTLGPSAFVHPHQQAASWNNMYAMYYNPVQSPVH